MLAGIHALGSSIACQEYPGRGFSTLKATPTHGSPKVSYFLVKKLCTIDFSNNDVTFTPITSRFVDLQNNNKRPTNGRFPTKTYQN